MSHHINKVRIKAVAKALKELNEHVVYIGGATISLYADEDFFYEACRAQLSPNFYSDDQIYHLVDAIKDCH